MQQKKKSREERTGVAYAEKKMRKAKAEIGASVLPEGFELDSSKAENEAFEKETKRLMAEARTAAKTVVSELRKQQEESDAVERAIAASPVLSSPNGDERRAFQPGPALDPELAHHRKKFRFYGIRP